MNTLEHKSEESTSPDWRISLPANDLLECFVAGLDDVILKIAVARAAKRQGRDQRGIRVEASDVEEASNLVLDQLLAQSDLSEELKAEIRESQECLKEKCRQVAR